MIKQNIHIPTVFENVVSKMIERTESTISAVSDNSGVYTLVLNSINFSKNMSVGMVCDINSYNFEVVSLSAYVIEVVPINSYVPVIGDKIKLAASFEYDHLTVLNDTLTTNSLARKKTFPLIWLMLDISEQKEQGKNYDVSADIRLAFAYYSTEEWKAKKRYEEIISTILQPLAESFLNEIKENRNNYFFQSQLIEFEKINRYKYGSKDKAGANVLNLVADAIEIELRNIKFVNNLNTCNYEL